MDSRTLAFALVVGAATAQAQVHPGSMYSIDLNYMPIPHLAQTWTASGYLVYNIQITRDEAGYITSLETVTPPPMDKSMEQYRTVGGRVDGVYAARTWRKPRDSSEYRPWRREVWNGDAKMDTLVAWEDSSATGWTPIASKRIYHTEGRVDSIHGRNWSGGAWQLQERTLHFNTGDRRDSVLTYTMATGADWNLTNKQVLFHSTDLDSIHGWGWNYDQNQVTLGQRYAITNGAGGRTASFTQQKWESGRSKWESGLGIAFSAQPLGIGVRDHGTSTDRIRMTPKGLEIAVAGEGTTRWSWLTPEGQQLGSGSFRGDRGLVAVPEAATGVGLLVLSGPSGTRRGHLVVTSPRP